jgi:hypothetical protein
MQLRGPVIPLFRTHIGRLELPARRAFDVVWRRHVPEGAFLVFATHRQDEAQMLSAIASVATGPGIGVVRHLKKPDIFALSFMREGYYEFLLALHRLATAGNRIHPEMLRIAQSLYPQALRHVGFSVD